MTVITIAESFLRRLRTATGSLSGLDDAAASKIGDAAAEAVVAEAAWSAAIGERYDTSQVCAMLSISRQALSKRQHSSTLIGLKDERTTWFPAWQFDKAARIVRPVVADVVAAFEAHLGDADPVIIAAWATTPQHDKLRGSTPAAWITGNHDHAAAVDAARQAALRLAQ